MARRQYRTAKFGSWERSLALDAQVTAAGRDEGIPFAFDRIERTPNTLGAHRLIGLAGTEGVQDAVVEAIFRAYFTEGQDLTSVPTLLNVASTAGLARSRAEALLNGDDGVAAIRIEQMLKTGGGSIVNTSSIFGLNGYPGWSLYVASKHAVTGMTKAAALDYARQNIRVNAVGPGPVETPLLAKGTGGDPHRYAGFVPMGRIGQPDEIAEAVVWLLSDDARYVTGHTLPVDGGVCAQ